MHNIPERRKYVSIEKPLHIKRNISGESQML